MAKSRWLTPSEVCDVLGVSRDTVDRRIADGRIACFRDGGIVRVSTAELERYLKKHTTSGDWVAPRHRRSPGRPRQRQRQSI